MVCSLPGSSVHGISQARILKWVAISFSRGSSQPRDQTCASCEVKGHCRWILYPLSHQGSPSNRMRNSKRTFWDTRGLLCNQVDRRYILTGRKTVFLEKSAHLWLFNTLDVEECPGSKIQLAFKPLAVSVESAFSKNSLRSLYWLAPTLKRNVPLSVHDTLFLQSLGPVHWWKTLSHYRV